MWPWGHRPQPRRFCALHHSGCGYLAGLADGIITTSRASQLARNSAVLLDCDSGRDSGRDSDHLAGVQQSEASCSKEPSGLYVANTAQEDAKGVATEPTPPLPTELPVAPAASPAPPAPQPSPVRHVRADTSPVEAAASGAVDTERHERRQAGAAAAAAAAADETAATDAVVTATAESKAAVTQASGMAVRTTRLRLSRPSQETMTLLRQRYGDA